MAEATWSRQSIRQRNHFLHLRCREPYDFGGHAYRRNRLYSYDGDGRLVQRTIGGVNRNYFWNEISQLGDILFETDMNGQIAASQHARPG